MPYEEYYNPYNGNLTTEQRQTNAMHICYNLMRYGFTLNAIAGMLGNFEAESYLNPNIVEIDERQNRDRYPGLGNYGYGLAQWTPWWGLEGSTVTQRENYHGNGKPTYGQWAMDRGYTFNRVDGGTGGEMYPQLLYLSEGQGGYNTSSYYNVTFEQYKNTTVDGAEAARIWYRNYERSRADSYGNRPTLGQKWYDFLYPIFGGGIPPEPPDPRAQKTLKGTKNIWRLLNLHRI